eukprot:6211846-Pleurochrysis_carterae.AAC.3
MSGFADGDQTVIARGGPYSEAHANFEQFVPLEAGSYRATTIDKAGDGFTEFGAFAVLVESDMAGEYTVACEG